MNCANDLFDELEFTKNQAIHLCAFLSDMPAGEDKNALKNEETRLTFGLVSTKRRLKQRLEIQKIP
jgi:hypothetical protein